jgi:hypothetical protein
MMFKKMLVVLFLVLCVSGFAAPEKTDAVARFVFVPGMAWPKDKNVDGIQLSVVGSQDKGKSINGFDLALFCTLTNNVNGAQGSLVSITENSNLSQGSVVNMMTKSSGNQGAVVNYMNESKGMQWGVVNIAKKSRGIQIGLVNIMDNGFLPVCILINFSWD